ncbi:MAG: cytochrome c biogenesis protein [Archaeoglobaceae archaeon]|nr:cytochrome c biogenesis protein [Archaeoglobaceae archaeon]MDW8118055.1 cytochrome c biogenesis protein CcsA [Archaeoglobaceae archaeon]
MLKFAKILAIVGLIMLLYGSYKAYTMPAKIESYRIVFFHVPSAITSYFAFTISFVSAIMYLRRGEVNKDRLAYISAKYGFSMAIAAFLSGAIWAKVTWGTYFNWFEIREVVVLLLLFVYAVYFSLRNIVESDKARISSIYLIIAFVTVPFSYVAGFFSPLHPKPFEAEFSAEWLANLWIMILAFLILYIAYTIWEYEISSNQKTHKTKEPVT